jgi:hypothetical protein
MCVLVVLTVLFVAEIRLSRSDQRRSEPPPPDLWENVVPPGRPAPSPVVTVTYAPPATNCPLLVSTNPNSQYTLTAVENGVLFDIDADGKLDRVAWTEPSTDVAFLALDRDGDGRITTGRELIGDRTVPGVKNAPNALMQIAAHPKTWGTLDSDNPLFSKLSLWTDANHNGQSEPAELKPAEDEVSAIELGYQPYRRLVLLCQIDGFAPGSE